MSAAEPKGQGGQNGAEDGVETNGTQVNGVQGRAAGAADQASAPSKARKQRKSWTMAQYRQASRRPLPTDMGDGSYRAVVKRPTLMQDLRSIGLGGKWHGDLKTLKDLLVAKLSGERQADDKTMIMERTIQLVATMPDHSARQEMLTNFFIDTLWTSLDHPPLLYMGDEFRFRQADGSNNNPLLPRLGAVGTAYARTVKPGKVNLGALPDPETVYEAVMARRGFRRNPNNVSSMLWYWATIIIHDLFHTNADDANINDSSSYLDLSPLYGNSEEALASVRTFADGMLKPDTFADRRMLGNPPGVCILLVMFNRFHNQVAAQLAAINENNRFGQPAAGAGAEQAAAARARRDEELFQTARLITSGLYINITLVDYVRNIINLNRVDTAWTLDPRQEMGAAAGTARGAESGVGNAVSAEFNLCYRWHSCISEMDEAWIEAFYRRLLGDDYGAMDLRALGEALRRFEAAVPADPARRTFGGLARGPDGRFDDGALADALATAIEQPGGAFGARNVPRIMKPVEMLGIVRGRRWHLAGLNEFRKHFGLRAHASFEDINADPAVADALRSLYQHPDCVELYPGIVAEAAKAPMVPGVGIAPTYTVSRVVLSDAVSLVRGDRHYTTDYHPGHLTQWGYAEAGYDLGVNHGCVFYKLFLRALPGHFRPDSVYAHYPMVVPAENRAILARLGRADRFSFERPRPQAPAVRVASPAGARHVLAAAGGGFGIAWPGGPGGFGGPGVGPGVGPGGPPQPPPQPPPPLEQLLFAAGWRPAVKTFYATVAERLLADKARRIAGATRCDVVRDVGNLAHTHFAARLFNLPLKTADNPRGVFSEQELYAALAAVFDAVALDLDPVKAFPLRQKAAELAARLAGIVQTNARLGSCFGSGGLFTARPRADDGLAAYGARLVRGLSRAGVTAHDIAWGHVIPTAATLVPNEAEKFALAVDFYLSPAGRPHLDELRRVASRESSDETDALLLGYALEGVRLAGAPAVSRVATAADAFDDGDGRRVEVRPGDRVLVAVPAAAGDGVNPRRPADAYVLGPGGRVADDIGRAALVELFRALFRRKGLRRAPGPQGELKRVPGPQGTRAYMSEDWGAVVPFPAAMKVVWDE